MYVLFSKTLNSHSASLYTGVYFGKDKFYLTPRDNLVMDQHPIQEGVEIHVHYSQLLHVTETNSRDN